MEENLEVLPSDIDSNNIEIQIPKKSKNNFFKTKECKVISYNKNDKTLDVLFDRFGIRIKNVENFDNAAYVAVNYKGEIGRSNFRYKL